MYDADHFHHRGYPKDINQNEPAATVRTVRTHPPVPPRSRLARVAAAIVWPLDRCAAFVGPALTGIGLGMLLVMAGIAVGSLAAAVTQPRAAAVLRSRA